MVNWIQRGYDYVKRRLVCRYGLLLLTNLCTIPWHAAGSRVVDQHPSNEFNVKHAIPLASQELL